MADFSMYAGDTTLIKVTVSDDAGTPVNISSADIRWQLAINVGATPLVTKSLVSGIAIVDGPTGRFDVTLDTADTESLVGGYYYEAEMIDSGLVSTVLAGTVQINPTLIKTVA